MEVEAVVVVGDGVVGDSGAVVGVGFAATTATTRATFVR